MNTLPLLKEELEHEYQTTRRFMLLFPEGQDDFRPHEKSMKLMPLATHLAEIFGWTDTILKTEVLDFGTGDYKPLRLTTQQQLVETLDAFYALSKAALEEISEEMLTGSWRMDMHGQLIKQFNKYTAIRHALNQATHHRAQLGVYYRLLNIPLPGSYGPSADDQGFQ